MPSSVYKQQYIPLFIFRKSDSPNVLHLIRFQMQLALAFS